MTCLYKSPFNYQKCCFGRVQECLGIFPKIIHHHICDLVQSGIQLGHRQLLEVRPVDFIDPELQEFILCVVAILVGVHEAGNNFHVVLHKIKPNWKSFYLQSNISSYLDVKSVDMVTQIEIHKDFVDVDTCHDDFGYQELNVKLKLKKSFLKIIILFCHITCFIQFGDSGLS